MKPEKKRYGLGWFGEQSGVYWFNSLPDWALVVAEIAKAEDVTLYRALARTLTKSEVDRAFEISPEDLRSASHS